MVKFCLLFMFLLFGLTSAWNCNMNGTFTWTSTSNYYSYSTHHINNQTFRMDSTIDVWTYAYGQLIGSYDKMTGWPISIIYYFPDGSTLPVQAVLHRSCNTIDLSSGSYYRGSPFYTQSDVEWTRNIAAYAVRCSIMTTQYTNYPQQKFSSPACPSSYYPAQFLRDFSYPHYYYPDSIANLTESKKSIEFMLSQIRQDGAIPYTFGLTDNTGQWCQRGDPQDLNCVVLDAATDAVLHVKALYVNTGDLYYVEKYFNTLVRAIQLAHFQDGVVYNDPAIVNVGVGFRDTLLISGKVSFITIHYYQAYQILLEFANLLNYTCYADQFVQKLNQIKDGIQNLIDPSTGMLIVSTDYPLLDVWASSFATTLDVLNSYQRDRIKNYLIQNHEKCFYFGHARGTPYPTLIGSYYAPEVQFGPRYQDGGYWGIGFHWWLPLIYENDSELACTMANEAVQISKYNFGQEWIGNFIPSASKGAPGYIATLVSLHLALSQMNC